MKAYQPQMVTLKDGRAVILRVPVEQDAQRIIDYIAVVCGETDQLGRSPGDPLPTLEEELKHIRQVGEDRLHLLAEFDGQIIAMANVGAEKRIKKKRHLATLGISIRKAYHNLGLGTILVRELVAWCRNHPGILKLSLGVFHDNQAAIAIYRKCGFSEEARLSRDFRGSDGRWLDEVIMSLWVKDGVDKGHAACLTIPVDDGLVLRLVEPAHAEEIFAVVDANRAHIGRWMPWVEKIVTLEDERKWLQNTAGQFPNGDIVFSILERGRIVGGIGILPINRTEQAAEVGYWLIESAQGRGIVTRACRAFISYLFDELKLHRVVIRAATGNRRSCAVCERLGLRREGLMKKAGAVPGGYEDLYLYAVLAEEWTQVQR